MYEFLKFIADILVPRFVTERCAILYMPGEVRIICREFELKPEDIYDEVVEVRSFNLFGCGLFPRVMKGQPQ